MDGFLGLGGSTSWLDVAQQGFTDFLKYKQQDQQTSFLQGLARSGQAGTAGLDKNGNPIYSVGVAGSALGGSTLLLIFGGIVLVLLLLRR